MKNILNIFKLEWKLSKNPNKSKPKKVLSILSYIFTFVLALIVSVLFVIVLQKVGGVENRIGTLSLFITVIQIALFFYSLNLQHKTIFSNNDKILLAYMPIKKWQIYIGKMLYCLVQLYITNAILTLPTLVLFGLSFDFTLSFYLMILPVTIIIPLLPFGLAALLSIPFMFLRNWLKNKPILNLALSIVITIVAFYVYNRIIFNAARVILLEDGTRGNIIADAAYLFLHKAIPGTWIAYTLAFENFTYGICLFIGSSIVIFILSIMVGCLSYESIFNRALIEKDVSKTIKTQVKQRKPFFAYFVSELKFLFRSTLYSYTYFGMAIAMPVMVYFCNKFILDFAVDSLGPGIIFGTTLLVVLIFVSIICSPTASFISREGDNFYILKTNPNGIKIPLFAKSLVGVLVSSVSLLISLSACMISGLLSFAQAFIILGVAIIFVFGLVALGILINMYRPNIFYSNKENNSNMIIHLFIGFIISVILGVMSIIFSFTLAVWEITLICVSIVVVFAVVCFTILLTQYEKLYQRMEQ